MTDLVPMDLSKLLGDLYETDSPPDTMSAEPSSPNPGPEWANEALLDEAFASWKPGPPDDAPAAERELADGYPGRGYQAASFRQLDAAFSGDTRVEDHGLETYGRDDHGRDDQLVDGDPSTIDGVLLESAQSDVAAGADVDGDPLAGPPLMWTRADDDVLPHSRGARRGRRLRLRRR